MRDLRRFPAPIRDEIAALLKERDAAHQQAAELRAEVDELRRQLDGATDRHGVPLVDGTSSDEKT